MYTLIFYIGKYEFSERYGMAENAMSRLAIWHDRINHAKLYHGNNLLLLSY